MLFALQLYEMHAAMEDAGVEWVDLNRLQLEIAAAQQQKSAQGTVAATATAGLPRTAREL